MTKPKPLPHQIPPEGEWDLWTIFADRAAGKTWAALDLARRWAADPVESTVYGRRPSRTAIFVRDVHPALDNIVYGPSGVVELELRQDGLKVAVDRGAGVVTFANGAEWRFFRYSRPDLVEPWMPDNAWIEDSEQARHDELSDTMRSLHKSMKWNENARVVMTCNRLPSWPCHMLAGGRNRLTVVGSVDVNTILAPEFRQRVLSEHGRGGPR